MEPDAHHLTEKPVVFYNGNPGMSLLFPLIPEFGNITHYPIVWREYLFRDVYANGIAAKVLNNILGPNPELRWINGNTVRCGFF